MDENNEVLNTYEYDAWGVIADETGSFDNPYKYAGYYYDTETGNYYLMSRYYNPEIARFISEDTYRGELTDPLSLNRYIYVVNNPMIYIDPDGYAPVSLITSGIGGLIGLGATFVQDLLDDWKINTDWKTYVGNTVQGVTTGFGLGLCGPTCGGIGGFAGDTINQYITKGEVDLTQSLVTGVTTYVTAGAFNVGGQVTSTGLNYIKDYAIRGAFAGVTGDVTYQYLNNGIVRDNYGKTTGYSFGQAIDNYNPVQTIKTGIAGSILAPIGAKVVETSINKWGPKVHNPLENVKYSDKVKDQMNLREYHGFPEAVDAFGADGKVTTFKGGDGITRTKVEIPGSYKGKTGNFEYIIEPDGSSNHRIFKPNK